MPREHFMRISASAGFPAEEEDIKKRWARIHRRTVQKRSSQPR